MLISLIVAMDQNRVIGRQNRLPWRLPADLKRFKALTTGKAIIMGRKTYESIGRPLAGRHNIVLTRNRDYLVEGCTVVNSVAEALAVAATSAGGEEVMVIGGARLYEQVLPLAGRIYLTLIDAEFEGDTFFPELEAGHWREVSREVRSVTDGHPTTFWFIVLERGQDRPGDSSLGES